VKDVFQVGERRYLKLVKDVFQVGERRYFKLVKEDISS
jgi:hypothetical protein